MSDNTSNDVILRVKASSSAAALAAAVAHNVYAKKNVSMRAIGAAAVNQAAKAGAIAQSFVGSKGIVLSFRFGFTEVKMSDATVTALVIQVIASGATA
jgi:stage V sporulation protein S